MVLRRKHATSSASPGTTSAGTRSGAREPSGDESRLHREAEAGVRLKAQRLRRALDADKLDDAVRIAADVAAELRSSAATELSPKSYYDVYLAVASELRLLEIYISELARRGAPILTLYERVQETPLVLPRLYLLITAGSVYVKSLQAPARDVLRDLVEMCAGVQHPQRGLFLRAYLAQMMKDKLPDVNNQYGGVNVPENYGKVIEVGSGSVLAAGEEQTSEVDSDKYVAAEAAGNVRDSVDFILRNFTEMNRLWVRMQHDCAPRDLPRREQERLELRLLVGSNISTLARLEGVDLPMYTSIVLPAVLDQIVSCHDAIAQEYLADCVAQVFPDDFQLATLDDFMTMCGQLVQGVNLKTILTSVIDRLTRYASQSKEATKQIRESSAFEVFRKHVPSVVMRQRETLSVADCIRVYLSLMNFVLKSEPNAISHVDEILGFAVDIAQSTSVALESSTRPHEALPAQQSSRSSSGAISGSMAREVTNTGDIFNTDEEDLVVRLLSLPIDTHRSVSTILCLTHFGQLQSYLSYSTRQKLAIKLLQSVEVYNRCITEVSVLHRLFDYVKCLAEDPPRFAPDGTVLPSDNSVSEEGMYDVTSLSSHHKFILSSVPGAASFASPADVLSGSPSSAISAGLENHVRFADSTVNTGSSGGVDDKYNDLTSELLTVDTKDFVRGQELISRIVYFCDDLDLSNSYTLHVALRERLRRGGKSRISITFPPLILSILRLGVRAGGALSSAAHNNVFDLCRNCLHFAFETTDAIRQASPETSLRLHLQISVTAASILRHAADIGVGRDGDRVDVDVLQQYMYENLSRSFEVFEKGVVLSSSQFSALELIIGTLVAVRSALDPGVYSALALRATKHARRLLTRSDQCLALCASVDLFWVSDAGEELMRSPKYSTPFTNGLDSSLDMNSHNIADALAKSSLAEYRDTGTVLMCVNDALDAARGCISEGEKVLLLMDIGHCLLKLHEMGCIDAAGEGRLDEVFRLSSSILDERSAKGSVVGRAANARLHRLRKHVKAHPNEYSALALRYV